MSVPSVSAPEAVLTRATLPWASHVEVLAHRAAHTPDALALGWVPQLGEVAAELSYAALDRRARAVAARLQALGAQGERVLLVMDNDPHYVAGFFACGRAGAIAVTLNVPNQKKHLTRLAQVATDADARFILSTRALAERFRERMDEVEALAALTWVIVDEVSDAAADGYVPHTPGPADPAFLQYTSGSTGTPRGVVVRHGDLVLQGDMIRRYFDLTPQDRALSWLPLFHDMGLLLGLLAPLHVGFPVWLTSPVAFVKQPAAWLRTISALGITLSGGPDFAYDLCCDVVDPASLAGVDLSRWAIAFNGAEPVRARTIDRFTETFAPLGFRPEAMNPSYGMAEATLGISTTRRGTRPVRRTLDSAALAEGRVVDAPAGRTVVASGRFIAGTRVVIVDAASRTPLGTDRIGEIWYGSDSVAEGYWRQEAETQAIFGATLPGEEGRFLRTGDLGFVDAHGNVTITGRAKDLIVVAGKNHFPSDLEQTAEAASPAVRPHFTAAFALDDGDREGVVVLAEIKAPEVAGLDVEAVGRAIMRRVNAEHEISIDAVALLEAGQIPKTTSGKVQRAQCRAAWLAGTLTAHGVVRRGGAA